MRAQASTAASAAASSGQVAGNDIGEDLDSLSQAECSDRFFHSLAQLKLVEKLTAKDACIVSFWAARSGLQGVGATLALHPSNTGGHLSDHFDNVTGIRAAMDDESMYTLKTPGSNRTALGRTSIDYSATPAYAAIAEELAELPSWKSRLREAVASNSFSARYTDHPVVQRSADVLPLGIFIDGIAIQDRDGALGLWVINLLTDRRHLCCVLRKRWFCRCGCGGWCTLWPMFEFARWSLQAMVDGAYPTSHHDGSLWVPGSRGDALRSLDEAGKQQRSGYACK